MPENKIKRAWAEGKAVVNGWLAIPDGFSAETKWSACASGSGAARCRSSCRRTPCQATFFTTQPVTQWKVETCEDCGSASSSS